MSSRTQSLIQNKSITLQRQMQRTLTKLKAPQPIGADILSVQGIPDNNQYYLNSLTLPAGYAGNWIYNITPVNQTLTLWNFAWTLYVDPTSFLSGGAPTDSFKFATGNAFSANSGQWNASVSARLDFSASSDVTNKRVFILDVRNNDSVSHVYYVAARFYLPYIQGQ